jgi:hypothetical protein
MFSYHEICLDTRNKRMNWSSTFGIESCVQANCLAGASGAIAPDGGLWWPLGECTGCRRLEVAPEGTPNSGRMRALKVLELFSTLLVTITSRSICKKKTRAK